MTTQHERYCFDPNTGYGKVALEPVWNRCEGDLLSAEEIMVPITVQWRGNMDGTDQFKARFRYKTLEGVKKAVGQFTAWITHILLNNDGTYSIMRHVNYEWCDYCTEENKGVRIHIAKEENDGLCPPGQTGGRS